MATWSTDSAEPAVRLTSHQRTSCVAALPRVFLGGVFLIAGYSKIVTSPSVEVTALLRSGGSSAAFTWYRAFAHAFVLPHSHPFGMLVVAGELYVGIALLCGVTTRLAAGVGVFLRLNFMCAREVTPWTPSAPDGPDIVLCLVVMFSAAGRTFGIDGFLYQRYPAIPLW